MAMKQNKETVNRQVIESQKQEEKTMTEIKEKKNSATQETVISEKKAEKIPTSETTTLPEVAGQKTTVKTSQKKLPAADKQSSTVVLQNNTAEVIEKLTGEVVASSTQFSSIRLEAGMSLASLCADIDQSMKDIKKSYLIVAIKIYAINNRKLYKAAGYTNIVEMAMKKWNLSAATTSCFLNICRRFGSMDQETGDCIGLRPEYENYSSSQLREMLPISEEHLSQFKPDMTVQEIRNRKKYLKEQNPSAEEETSADKKQKKSSRTKNLELLAINNPADLDNDKSALMEKLDAFENSHPGLRYRIIVNLTYEEE